MLFGTSLDIMRVIWFLFLANEEIMLWLVEDLVVVVVPVGVAMVVVDVGLCAGGVVIGVLVAVIMS